MWEMRRNIGFFPKLPIEKTVHVELAVFQRLANDQFCNANRCIVISVSIFPKILASFASILLLNEFYLCTGKRLPRYSYKKV
jgi:hypothetical protein